MTDYLPPEDTTAPATPTAVPHSREAEEAVVGAVFINPEVYYDVAQFLTADDFYRDAHQVIYRGAGGRMHLRPGYAYELEDHPFPSFNTKYLTIVARHTATTSPTSTPKLTPTPSWPPPAQAKIDADGVSAFR